MNNFYIIMATIGSVTMLSTFLWYRYYLVKHKKNIEKTKIAAQSLIEEAKIKNKEILIKGEQQVNEIKIQGKIKSKKEIESLEEELHIQEIQLEKEFARLEIINKSFEDRRKEINKRYNNLKAKYNIINKMRSERKGSNKSQLKILEKVCQTSKDEIIENMVSRIIERAENEAESKKREWSDLSEIDYVPQAKRIIGISIGRIGHTVSIERYPVFVTGTVNNFKKFLKTTGKSVEYLQELFEIPLIVNEDEKFVTIRFDTIDTIKREIARRVLEKSFVIGKQIPNFENFYAKKKTEMENELIGLGRKAFKVVGLPPKAHKDIIILLGRLYYRTSYTQNQWLHSVEAAELAGLLAHELKIDVNLAKRAALLHDIGKALTHKIEGSHAVIGAEVARKCNENPLIVNAIESHHGDVPEESLFAKIVMACDALSGARPGARRELVETYFDRIRDLENVARQFKGVKEVHAVQAGRELRVLVDNKEVSDEKTGKLADEIAAKISNEVTFPGRIRVTVIRQFNTVEYAK